MPNDCQCDPNSHSSINPSPLLTGHVRAVDPEEDNKVFELLYDYETTQLKRDAFSREVTFAGTNRSAIYIESVGSTAHNLGVLRGDKIALCIPLIDPNSKWWGRSLGHDSVPICRSGQTIHLTCHHGHRHVAVIVDRDLCEESWESDGRAPGLLVNDVLKKTEQRFLRVDAQRLKMWGHRLSKIVNQSANQESHLSATALENELITAVRSLFEEGEPMEFNEPVARSLVESALIQSDSSSKYAQTISDLCVKLNVSRRTLELAFQKITGKSPLKFLMQRRLGRAYEMLKQGSPDSLRVTDVAMACGFHEFGRFACRYRQAFNETPRQTLYRRTLPSSRSCSILV